MSVPVITWMDETNQNQIATPFNWGTIDADSSSDEHTFLIWNNRGGTEDLSKMEEVTITTTDLQGGKGDTVGSEVPAVKDNWFKVKVLSLDETTFTDIGGSVDPKPVGTAGSTYNLNADTAPVWVAETAYAEGDYVKPTADNTFIYKCVVAGNSGTTEPVWATEEYDEVVDTGVTWETYPITQTPASQEILGIANDGDLTNAAGNYIKVTIYAEVPLNAQAGRQNLNQRISYRFV